MERKERRTEEGGLGSGPYPLPHPLVRLPRLFALQDVLFGVAHVVLGLLHTVLYVVHQLPLRAHSCISRLHTTLRVMILKGVLYDTFT